MTPDALIKVYPWMDLMIAESLIEAYKAGTLMGIAEKWEAQTPKPVETHVVKGAITIENNPCTEVKACEDKHQR